MLEQPARVFSSSLKERIVLRLEGGERIRAVAAETGIRRKLLYAWRDAYRSMGVAGFNRKRGPKPGWKERRAAEGRAPSAAASSPDAAAAAARPSDELAQSELAQSELAQSELAQSELAQAKARIGELERVIGRQQADLHFFREALRLWDANGPSADAPTSTRSSKK